jgi:hypothetical protein
MSPGAKVVGKEGLGKGERGDSRQQGEGRIDEPNDAERFYLAGVGFDLELEAGYWGNHCGGRTAALGAEWLP